MANLPLPGCRQPGCPERQSPGKRYCEQHERERWRELDRDRGSSTERGYGHDWRKFRDWFLTVNPLCMDCRDAGRLKPASEVHHIVKVQDDPTLRLVAANCRSLCTPCHAARTRRGE